MKKCQSHTPAKQPLLGVAEFGLTLYIEISADVCRGALLISVKHLRLKRVKRLTFRLS
jgi:hypothetical protein